MTVITTTLLVLVLLVLLNAIFTATELAVTTARRSRLMARAEEGDRGAEVALELQEDPNRFLSTVQVGITLLGTLAAIYSGDRLEAPLTAMVQSWAGEWTRSVVFTVLVVGLSYLQLVLGELVPKRLGLQSAETIASFMSRPMLLISQLVRPMVWLLGSSTSGILWLLRRHQMPEETVTQDDIRHMVRESAEDGHIQEHEEDLIDSVFRMGGRVVRQVRTPRTDVVGIDLALPLEEQIDDLVESGYSRFPAYREDLDHVEGVILAKDLWRLRLERPDSFDLAPLVRTALFVPENTRALQLLQLMQKQRAHLAVVVNEHGIFEGIATLEDLLEEIVGDIQDETDEATDPDIVDIGGGRWLVSGSVEAELLKETLGMDSLPHEEEGYYDTIAGLVLSLMGKIPTTGDEVDSDGWAYRVVDMDGLRIDKIEVTRLGAREAD